MTLSAELILAEALQITPASLPSHAALGKIPQWDSVGHLRLLLLLEERYGADIDENSLNHIHNLETLRQFLQQARPATEPKKDAI